MRGKPTEEPMTADWKDDLPPDVRAMAIAYEAIAGIEDRNHRRAALEWLWERVQSEFRADAIRATPTP
jgi:hypothetical protein